MSSVTLWLSLAALVLTRCTHAQAPGDGDPICTEETITSNGEQITNPFFAFHPVYSPNERPLMDSRDYARLLTGSGGYLPWQSVDRDNNNSPQIITEWVQTVTATCAGSVTACGFSVGAQENWLITQHINTTVLPGGERLRKVTVVFEGALNGCDISHQCRQSFEVYKWETSTINTTAAANTDNYVRVDRVSPAISDEIMSFVERQDIQLDANEDGFYLAVVDLSTCVTLARILVFYHVCPEETSQLVSRPEAIDSQSLGGSHSVVGECVQNSSTETGVHPVLVCGPMGQWQVIVPCLCDPGYQLNTTQDQCIECPEGTYSAEVGNGPCQTCPANSQGTGTGLSVCPCLQDYYRAPYEGPSHPCTRSPGRPSNLRVLNVTSTSVDLSWSPPVVGGGRPPSEIFYTITTLRDGVRVGETEVTGNETTTVTGLSPGVLYTFSVTAENDVSSQDNNTNARTLSVFATTDEEEEGATDPASSSVPSSAPSPTTSLPYLPGSTTTSPPSTSPTAPVSFYTPATTPYNSPTSESSATSTTDEEEEGATDPASSSVPSSAPSPTTSLPYSPGSTTTSPPSTSPTAPVPFYTPATTPYNSPTSESSATSSTQRKTLVGLSISSLVLLFLL